MNYIVFDMEWNQPTPGAILKYKNEQCLNNEIIQIGAVKLNDNCEIIDTYSVNVKPKIYKEINKNVKRLTGIDEKILIDALSIEEAIEQFKSWCGYDYVFITWGYDDIGVLGANLKYFGLDTKWLPGCYNLQMIFCAQTDNENKQYSLTYATEYFKVITDKPLHNALTDAYYTALICQNLDIKKGMETYRAMVFKDKSIPEHMKNIIYKKNYKKVKGYNELIEKTKILKPVCYECLKPMKVVKSAKNGIYNYLTIAKCQNHGEFAEYLRINMVDNGSFCATEQYFLIDKYNKSYFLTRLKKMAAQDKKRQKDKKVKLRDFMKNTKEDTLSKLSKVNTRRKILKISEE